MVGSLLSGVFWMVAISLAESVWGMAGGAAALTVILVSVLVFAMLYTAWRARSLARGPA